MGRGRRAQTGLETACAAVRRRVAARAVRLEPFRDDGRFRFSESRRPRLHLPLRLREGRSCSGECLRGVRQCTARRYLDAGHVHFLYGRHNHVRAGRGSAPPRQCGDPFPERRTAALSGGGDSPGLPLRRRRTSAPRGTVRFSCSGILGASSTASGGGGVDRLAQRTALRFVYARRAAVLASCAGM